MRVFPLLVLLAALPACFLLAEDDPAEEAPGCGDDTRGDAEACDGIDDGACPGHCRADCTCPACGDGRLDAGEACDDGGDGHGDCTRSCALAFCGDGVQRTRSESGAQLEACDDGALNGTEASDCPVSCTAARCGDHELDPGEQCDEGAANGTPASECTQHCRGAVCGDGVVSRFERCDGTRGCSDQCELDACAVVAVDAFYSTSLFVRGDGVALGCGGNRDGTSGSPFLPTGEEGTSIETIRELPLLKAAVDEAAAAAGERDQITQLRLGKGWGAALSDRGRIFTWGRHDLGARGTGSMEPPDRPITLVSAGAAATRRFRSMSITLGAVLAVSEDGEIVGWGVLRGGALGPREGVPCTHGYTCEPTPVVLDIEGSGTFREISASMRLVSALTADGTLMMWGTQVFGEMGVLPPGAEGLEPSCRYLLPIEDPLTLPPDMIGHTVWPPITPPGIPMPVRSASTGFAHTAVVDAAGDLWLVGNNCYGQVSPFALAEPPGPECTEPGRSFCYEPAVVTPKRWDLTETIGAESRDLPLRKVAAGTAYAVWALDEQGRVLVFGSVLGASIDVRMAEPLLLPGGAVGVDIVAGDDHAFVRTADGQLFVIGSNGLAQRCTGAASLGDGLSFEEVSPCAN